MIKLDWYTDPVVPDVEADARYRKAHRKTKRIKKCLELVHGWAGYTSIIDVGCKSLGFLELVDDRYTDKLQVDYCQPVIFDNTVPFKKVNFASMFIERYVDVHDVVVCLEVMEHVEPDERRHFATNLLKVAGKQLLVSIPYNWPPDGLERHPHGGINQSNLLDWFYPWWPDWTHIEGCHLIACFDKQNLRDGTTYE